MLILKRTVRESERKGGKKRGRGVGEGGGTLTSSRKAGWSFMGV